MWSTIVQLKYLVYNKKGKTKIQDTGEIGMDRMRNRAR
jgi:hypothetical protein